MGPVVAFFLGCTAGSVLPPSPWTAEELERATRDLTVLGPRMVGTAQEVEAADPQVQEVAVVAQLDVVPGAAPLGRRILADKEPLFGSDSDGFDVVGVGRQVGHQAFHTARYHDSAHTGGGMTEVGRDVNQR